jgi:putative membrane protein
VPWFLQIPYGLLVGVAGLLPGVSGSTLLVLGGLYRPLTGALAHPLRDFRRLLLPLAPFLLAAGLGLLLGSRLLAAFFARHETAALYLFMGLMFGALPHLWQHAHRAGGGRRGWWLGGLMFLLCVGGALLDNHVAPRPDTIAARWSIWLLAGAGIGLGSVIPGASVAFILIYLGLYQPLLDGVAALDLNVLLPLGGGALAAILGFARLADWLFRHAEGLTTRAIFGLVAGSIPLLYPGWPGGTAGLRALLLFAVGALLSTLLNKYAPDAPARG